MFVRSMRWPVASEGSMPGLEAWAQSAQALVSATMELPGATEESRSAEAFARAAGVPGAWRSPTRPWRRSGRGTTTT